MGFPGESDDKLFAHSAGDRGSIPGLGRSPGEGNGYPLQYSCLENSMDWQTTVHGVAKGRDTAERHFSLSKETRYLKLRNVALFYVWEDARVGAHWNLSKQLSYLGTR